MTDIEIAHSKKMTPIVKIAKKMHISKNDIELYGNYKAKINVNYGNKNGKLILVTAINPTKSGIGKTTVSIGLCDGLRLLKKDCALALREPSLGPVFGVKGGATGGGYSQVVPMEDINLHFTGDFHAITSANNLLSSMIDNHIYQGNELDIDPSKILFHRCIDLNDRALRHITVGQNDKKFAPVEDEFTITSASETMAICTLSKDMADLKRRLGNILIALNSKGEPIYARDLKAVDAMAILLKDVLKPNLVQTLGGSPALVHLGPFANIAHGCNSVIATKLALSKCDYVVTEAGFGADLGAEKFLDIKCRVLEDKPSAVVLVVTLRALKLHGNVSEDKLQFRDDNAILMGLGNLSKHIDTIVNVYHLPLVVTINKYQGDDQNELSMVENFLKDSGVRYALNDVWALGGKGAIDLSQEVLKAINEGNSEFTYAYELQDTLETKIEKLLRKVYGGSKVVYSEKAKKDILSLRKMGKDLLPICIAKTQYSLSDDSKKLGKPTDFTITIKDLELKNGAEFIVAKAGNIMLMPGLSRVPSAVNMTIDSETNIINGLF